MDATLLKENFEYTHIIKNYIKNTKTKKILSKKFNLNTHTYKQIHICTCRNVNFKAKNIEFPFLISMLMQVYISKKKIKHIKKQENAYC